jgi:hypothetical protein
MPASRGAGAGPEAGVQKNAADTSGQSVFEAGTFRARSLGAALFWDNDQFSLWTARLLKFGERRDCFGK